ncbi:hypothetical protein M3P05_20435, partial [Sansalvadorimonas sp. 2012CJ34-2]
KVFWEFFNDYGALGIASCKSHCVQKTVFELLVLPKLKKIIRESDLKFFDEDSVAYGNSVLNEHDEYFMLLIKNMRRSDSVIDMFLKIPETFRPYLLWWLTKMQQFEIVNQILSVHEEYKKVLHVIDKSSGNSCLHQVLHHSHFYEFRTLVEMAQLRPLFGQENFEGKFPHDFYGAAILDVEPSDLVLSLKIIDFLFEVLPLEKVQVLLERLIIDFKGRGGRPLIHIVAYGLQNGLTLRYCPSIYQNSECHTDNIQQLEKVYPLLSTYLPVTANNYKTLADQLIESDLSSQAIVCILVALPEPYSREIVAELLQHDHGFVKGLLNTG